MATAAQLSENSHQGFEGLKAALYLGSTEVNSNTASGLQLRLWRNCIRSRSSGKERDAETGLDYFLARYYSGAQGRFLSVDPGNAGASSDDPQSWNAYAYSRNNPLKYTDPDGKRYKVCWEKSMGGDCLEMTDPEYADYRQQNIDPVGYIAGGNIYQKDVVGFVLLGTVKWLGDDRLWAVKSGAELAGPTVNALAIATGVISGGFAALDLIAGGGGIEALHLIGRAATTLWPSYESGRQIINGIEYSIHALERMAPSGLIQKGTEMFSRGVPVSVVENAIKYGAKSPGNEPGTIVHQFENIRVVTNSASNFVITVIKTGN